LSWKVRGPASSSSSSTSSPSTSFFLAKSEVWSEDQRLLVVGFTCNRRGIGGEGVWVCGTERKRESERVRGDTRGSVRLTSSIEKSYSSLVSLPKRCESSPSVSGTAAPPR